jgi:hypothetical protein
MKRRFIIGFLVMSVTALAQSKIEKHISVQNGQHVKMDFMYPDLIQIQTWDRSEILISGTVSINKGENDDSFDLQIMTSAKEITIQSMLKDKENIPHRIVIKKGDTEYFFKTDDYNDPSVKQFMEGNNGKYAYKSDGIIKQITLEVFVPEGMETELRTKFGLVEVKDFKASLTVSAKFGGVDVSVAAAGIGELTARTRFGEILTNLDVSFDSNKDEDDDHWTIVSAKPGTGPRYELESKFGKVYLRKAL